MKDPTPLHRGYRLLARLLLLPLVAWLWWRGHKEPGYRRNMGQRLGFVQVRPGQRAGILIQAASVGEVQAARPLIEALKRTWPDHALMVCTHTPTGAATLQSHWGESIAHSFTPLDTPGACARFLDRVQPRALILMERELWPEMLLQCRQRAIPVLLVNARMSEHSLRLYQRWQGLVGPIWSQLARVAAADPASLERLQRLGVPGERLAETGNLKFDMPSSGQTPPSPAWLKERHAIVAGSTHEAEESALLAAWPAWQARHPEALLVLVPRHPQRFKAVAERLQQSGLAFARHSLGGVPTAATQVLLADTMGELTRWYQFATVCFIGGTLAPIGGHNPLEALAVGKPVLFGPHIRNAQTLFEAIEQAGAGRRVDTAQALLDTAATWIDQPDERAQGARQAHAFMQQHRGAQQRCLDAIAPWLGQPPAALDETVFDTETLWHDPSRLSSIQPAGFDPTTEQSAHGALATGSGRGQALRVTIDGNDAVLRHYRRGGLMARISKDKYWRAAPTDSRAMREFALLRLMRSWNLPVPQPLAARHHPSGCFYSADILVAMIPGTLNVAQLLSQRALVATEWQALGAAVRKLHERQVWHADLNCHNLLLDAEGRAWVIDFDRCEMRANGAWKQANLDRLLRSLRKEKGRLPVFHWQEADWAALLQGYEAEACFRQMPRSPNEAF